MTETKTCRAAGTAGLSLIAFFILPNAGCGKQAAQGAARTPSPTVVVVVETAVRPAPGAPPSMRFFSPPTPDAAKRRARAPPGRQPRMWWLLAKTPSARD